MSIIRLLSIQSPFIKKKYPPSYSENKKNNCEKMAFYFCKKVIEKAKYQRLDLEQTDFFSISTIIIVDIEEYLYFAFLEDPEHNNHIICENLYYYFYFNNVNLDSSNISNIYYKINEYINENFKIKKNHYSFIINLNDTDYYKSLDDLAQIYTQNLLNEKKIIYTIPKDIQESCQKFKLDHPDQITAFIIMQFGSTKGHEIILDTIRKTLENIISRHYVPMIKNMLMIFSPI